MPKTLIATNPMRHLNRILQSVKWTSSGCWVYWAKPNAGGYARIQRHGKVIYVHRFTYSMLRGPIPEGFHLDHLCRVTACCNPWHLEVVTPEENRRRQAAAITHCPEGHPYDEANTYIKPDGNRNCKACKRRRTREWRAAR